MATDIVETDGINADEIDVSRWQNYGKDRLYINKFGNRYDSSYVDLDGDEGHATWSGASFNVTGERVIIEWRERGVPRSKIADGYEPKEKRAVLEVSK
jgi:hypothetical protein